MLYKIVITQDEYNSLKNTKQKTWSRDSVCTWFTITWQQNVQRWQKVTTEKLRKLGQEDVYRNS